jgi:hypothetical protein
MGYRLAGQCLEGTVIGWLKSLTGTPALPSTWVECNNQTLSNSQSVYDTKTMPNLNNTTVARFIRGSSAQSGGQFVSGGTGGSTGHTHCLGTQCEYAPFPNAVDCNIWDFTRMHSQPSPHAYPMYYEVVWIVCIIRSVIPIGGICSFLTSMTGVPALPDEFVLAEGQTITDSQSIYSATSTVLPNLNGASGEAKRFLKGSSVQSSGLFVSGGTGGCGTHTHTRAAGHWCYGGLLCCSSFCPVYLMNYKSNNPPYYEAPYVVRIK